MRKFQCVRMHCVTLHCVTLPVLHNTDELLTKLDRSRWLDVGQVLDFFYVLWTAMVSRAINTQKLNEASIQPS